MVLFNVFLFLTTYGLLNIVTGVIVEQTLAISKENDTLVQRRKDQQERRLLEELKALFLDADSNASSALDRKEFCRMFEPDTDKGKVARAKFEELGVPVDNAEEMFSLFDQSPEGEIDLVDFFNGVLRLRGTAGSKDLMKIVGLSKSISRRVGGLEEQVDVLHGRLQALPEVAAGFTSRLLGEVPTSPKPAWTSRQAWL